MIILITILAYFAILFGISHLTSKHADNSTFYRANRRAPWYMVAFGMIGASISGVTFVSVPGMVLTSQMTYLQMCLGFIGGYLVIAFVLLPLYYRLNLTSIYTYLGQRLGVRSYLTGASFFLLSKMTGAAVRFYVVCIILQQFVFAPAGIPFEVNVIMMVLLIWLYTRRGGIGTLVFTDSFQTLCLFTALILIILSVIDQMHLSVSEAITTIANSEMSRIFVFDDWVSPHNFWKQFLSGVFVAIVMTGLDQDMMQKNLTCKTLRDAQKDMCSYGMAFVPANLLFLALGVLLTMVVGTGLKGDEMLPTFIQSVADTHLLSLTTFLFIIGIVAASFSSADSALTSLTTCFCVDICRKPDNEALRKRTHIVMCGFFMLFILLFRQLNSTSLIDAIYILASYTYGPLLGLFTFGLFTKRQPNDRLVPYICIASPLLCYVLDRMVQHVWDYHFGYELLMLNGLLTFIGLYFTRKNPNKFGFSLAYSYLCTQNLKKMNIEALISKAAQEAVKALYGMDATEKMVQLQKTRSEFEGNLTLVVFPFVKAAKKSPEQTAQEIGEYLTANCPAVEKFNVVKGFLNLSIGDGAWLELLKAIDADEHFGMKQATEDSPLVMIEYSSPNTNKPLHLGHVRNNLLGWSLAQIMEANGNKVVKTNIVNDRGIHICKSMLAWLKYGHGETPESSGKKGDHLIGDYYVAFDKHYRDEIKDLVAQGMDEEKAKQEAPLIKEAHEMLVKWEQNDPEVRALWEKMNNWVYAGFDETYKKLGVGFDKIYYESQTYLKGKAKVEEGLAKGLFERHEDNSVWADLTNEGLDQKLLLRSDGTSVYMTQDIGTAEMRFQDYPIDKMIYVVGNEQNYHFQVLSILLDRLGFKWGKELVHFSYGMVELPNGKMKSREGTVVDADDLMELMVSDALKTSMELGKFDDMSEEERNEIARIVGMGALKYFILKVDARKNMLFNPEESIDFNGNTGPFIQYTYARIRSILRKAETENLTPAIAPIALAEKEVELVQKMNEFGAAVEQAGKDYSPSGIANYCYELTKVFNQFYHDYSILNEADADKKAVRLMLAKNVAKIIKNGMGLLGIEVPERM